jgi:hypothetical protein
MDTPRPPTPISRRQFLYLVTLGAAGLILQPAARLVKAAPALGGRVFEDRTAIYDRPSFNSSRIKYLWKDSVVTVFRATVGDETPSHNRIWYELGENQFIHSSSVQPVQTLLNNPIKVSQGDGQLAEVTVPFTDAHWGPARETPVAYRYYYSTTHWVTDLVADSKGDLWYCVKDDKWDYHFYVPGKHLRLIPEAELAPLSHNVPASAKRIEVRTGEQTLVAYEWEKVVFKVRISSGARFSTGDYSTPTGSYSTFHKRPSRHMAAGDLASNGYDLPGVPWVTYFTEEGMAIHGTYWHNDYGRPRSHGCINLVPLAARWVYLWTLPYVPASEQKTYETYGTALVVV